MHGRVKTSVQPSASEQAAKRAQIGKYVAAKDLFLQRRSVGAMDDRTADLTAKLVELNPDFYTLWALRKEMLLNNIAAQSAQPAHCTTTLHVKCTRGLLVGLSHSLCCLCAHTRSLAHCALWQSRACGRVVFERAADC